MIIRVVNPSVHMLTSLHDARKALALCAYHAGISRGRITDTYEISDPMRPVTEVVGCPFEVMSGLIEHRSFADAERLVGSLLTKKPRPHDSIIEHGNISFLFEMSRICSHEQVRHKIGLGLTQMSTRFIEEKNVVRFIKPPHIHDEDLGDYTSQMVEDAEAPDWVIIAHEAVRGYRDLRTSHGEFGQNVKRESARYILPHCLATHIGITGNFRAWRHIIRERTAKPAAPEIKGLYFQVKEHLARISPVLVEGL
jgi:flavin-dependent thymidylate synthase